MRELWKDTLQPIEFETSPEWMQAEVSLYFGPS